jgi:hypothetical protein
VAPYGGGCGDGDSPRGDAPRCDGRRVSTGPSPPTDRARGTTARPRPGVRQGRVTRGSIEALQGRRCRQWRSGTGRVAAWTRGEDAIRGQPRIDQGPRPTPTAPLVPSTGQGPAGPRQVLGPTAARRTSPRVAPPLERSRRSRPGDPRARAGHGDLALSAVPLRRAWMVPATPPSPDPCGTAVTEGSDPLSAGPFAGASAGIAPRVEHPTRDTSRGHLLDRPRRRAAPPALLPGSSIHSARRWS